MGFVKVAILAVVWIAGCSQTVDRQSHWAVPVGPPESLPNCWRIDRNLLRGAQPTPEGFAALSQMGVKTVVNVRLTPPNEDLARQVGLESLWMPMNPWAVDEEVMVRFLQTATDEQQTPVFVHCVVGKHRAALLTAVYRIVVQGWGRQETIDEMTGGGHGYWPIWDELNYLRTFDIEAMRKRVGLPARIVRQTTSQPAQPDSPKMGGSAEDQNPPESSH